MPTYTVNDRPVTVDDLASTSIQVQNTGTVGILIEPLGRQVAPGATVTVPGWSTRRTRLRSASGVATTAVVTLTAGSPAAQPGPGVVTFDPGPASSMSVSISGGSWFTDEGLTTAASFPRTISAVTALYPAAPASIVVTATVGTSSQTRGMNVVDGCAETFTWTPSSSAEVIGTALAEGSGGAISSVVGQTGVVTGAQILADTTVAGVLAARALLPDTTASTATTGTLTAGQFARIDTTSAAASRTLPSAATAGARALTGAKVVAGSNALTLNRAGADTINGSATSRVISPPEAAVTLASDGVSNWSVVSTDTPATQLSGTYAGLGNTRLTAGRRWAFFGDSITNGSSASNFAYSYVQQAILSVGSWAARLDSVEAGTTGYNSNAVLAYVPTVVAAYPDISAWCLMIGTNDATQGVSLATYSANVAAAVAKLKPYGPGVICTVPPKSGASSTTTTRQLIAQYNTWIKIWGPANGLQVADVHATLVDPATGDLLSTVNTANANGTGGAGDGTHPNNYGHTKMAGVVARAILRCVTATPLPVEALSTSVSLCPNPLNASGAGAGLPSGGYNAGGSASVTYSKVADVTGQLPAGLWAQTDFDGTSYAGGFNYLGFNPPAFTASVGDTVALLGVVQVEDVSGDWEAKIGAQTAVAGVALLNQSVGQFINAGSFTPGVNLGNVAGTGNNIYQIGPFFSPKVIPAGQTGFLLYGSVTCPTGSHYKAKFGCLDVWNLTTLNLASVVGGSNIVNVDGP